MEITIDLIDKRHIVARSKVFKHGAANWHEKSEKEARELLTKMLKEYKKGGYVIEIIAKDSYRVTKR